MIQARSDGLGFGTMHHSRYCRLSFSRDFTEAVMTASMLLVLSLGPAYAGAYTPPAGSPERKAIYDALRATGDDHTRVFIIDSLKVDGGWAWTSVKPQSADGKQQFEPESALLHKVGARWQLLDQPCGEGDCDPQNEIARIRAAHPDAPADIFPQ
jgi:hypothetical protein